MLIQKLFSMPRLFLVALGRKYNVWNLIAMWKIDFQDFPDGFDCIGDFESFMKTIRYDIMVSESQKNELIKFIQKMVYRYFPRNH